MIGSQVKVKIVFPKIFLKSSLKSIYIQLKVVTALKQPWFG